MSVPKLQNLALASIPRSKENELRKAGMKHILMPSSNAEAALKNLRILRMNSSGNSVYNRLKIGNSVWINNEWTGTVVGAKKVKNNTSLFLANATYQNVSNGNGGRWYLRENSFKNKIVEVEVTQRSNITEY